jgi:hypothetical protein
MIPTWSNKKNIQSNGFCIKKNAFESVAFSDYQFIHRVASEMSKEANTRGTMIFGQQKSDIMRNSTAKLGNKHRLQFIAR